MINSSNAAPIFGNTETAVTTGSVESIGGGRVEVRISGASFSAKTAFSCLVQPRPGDRVICARGETGEYFILGITERPGSQDLTMSFPGDATMLSEQGDINMMSGKSVTLASGDKLNCFSEQAIHKSRDAVVDFDKVTARGTTFQASYKTVLLVGGLINTMAKQIIERARNYIRQTEECDRISAGELMRKTDGLYSMDSRRTVLISKKDTKIDGEHIFMG